MADELAFFTASAAAKIAEIVRREIGRTQNRSTPRGDTKWGDNEWSIDGVCDAGCSVDSLGICSPNIPIVVDEEIYFWNALADIEPGARIVIHYSHRSGTAAERNHGVDSDIPTPWILGPATCSE